MKQHKYMHETGFSLVEMLIVLLIVGILAGIAFPSYKQSVYKGRRSDAISTLLNIQLEQEKWRTHHTTYGSLANLGIQAVSEKGYYAIGITSNDAAGYVTTATAVNDQLNDTGCTILSLTVHGTGETSAPAPCW